MAFVKNIFNAVTSLAFVSKSNENYSTEFRDQLNPQKENFEYFSEVLNKLKTARKFDKVSWFFENHGPQPYVYAGDGLIGTLQSARRSITIQADAYKDSVGALEFTSALKTFVANHKDEKFRFDKKTIRKVIRIFERFSLEYKTKSPKTKITKETDYKKAAENFEKALVELRDTFDEGDPIWLGNIFEKESDQKAVRDPEEVIEPLEIFDQEGLVSEGASANAPAQLMNPMLASVDLGPFLSKATYQDSGDTGKDIELKDC